MTVGLETYFSEEELKLNEQYSEKYWNNDSAFGVVNNSAPDEIKNYQIKAKDGKCWKKIHLELMGSGSHTSSVPIRQILCKNERTHSETTGCYELTKIEADTLKNHPDIEWVQLDPEYHEEARIPVELHSINRFGKSVKNYRNLTKPVQESTPPTEVANSLIATTGSPNWIKVSDSHPNTPAMNYWNQVCQDLTNYAVYPSAPANSSDPDTLRQSIQTGTNDVTCPSAGHYQLQVWADGEWSGLMIENIATGFKIENNDTTFRIDGLLKDERGRGHCHEIMNLGYLEANTQLRITYKVRNGSVTSGAETWAVNPGGIGWKLLFLGYTRPDAANYEPMINAFPNGTSSTIPSSEDNRTNYGPLRMATAATNPWSSDPYTVVNSDVTYDNDGTDIDLIIVDTGTWTGHPEFCTNNKDPQNFIPGNVLSRSGKSGVLDLALDAPYYLDPQWFDADPTRLVTRWDGTKVPEETTARNWWFSSVLRSSTFNAVSAAAGTGNFSITIPITYNRVSNCGTDTTPPTNLNDHGTKCGGVAYGKNFGKAFNANKWALAAIDVATGVTIESAWTMQKIFHKTKPDNPKFSGNSAKNPTVSSNSWGFGSAYIGFFIDGGARVKYNFRGTETTESSRPIQDVYGNPYKDLSGNLAPYPEDNPDEEFDWNSYTNPYTTKIPAFARVSSRNGLITVGPFRFGYYWRVAPHLRAENTEEPREGFAAEYNAALEAVNSGIHFCNSSGNDQNYFVDKNDVDYNNWISRLDANGNVIGVANDSSSHKRVYPNRSSYPSQLAYDATGLNTMLSIGAIDDRYNSNYPFSSHSSDPKHDSGTIDSNFTGNKLEQMAAFSPRGKNIKSWDLGATFNNEINPFWKDRFSGWYFDQRQYDALFYSNKGSAVDFFAPADGMLSANGKNITIYNDDNGFITRNDDIPASWNSSTQAYLDGYFDGTSSACPAFAGTIACVLQQNRTTSPVHLKSYLKDQISDATNFFTGYAPSSANDLLWLVPNSNMGKPLKIIKEVTTDINTPNVCYTENSGIDANRNLNERFTITSASGASITIRGIRQFSEVDVSSPVSLRVVGGGSAGARYYPVYPTGSLTLAERGLIRFRIKPGSNDQILEVSNNYGAPNGSTYTYFSIRVVNGNFIISRQGLVYYYLNVGDDVSLPSDTNPTYILSTNQLTVNEGSQLITTVQTTYVAQNTILYWSLSGTGITASDFSAGSLTGQVSIAANGNAVFNHTLANDLSTEGTETINIKLFTDASRNTQVATTNVNINDTSKGSTYSISPSASSVDEGSSITYTITTTNVEDGTTLYWSFGGTNVDADDFSPAILTGSSTVITNQSTATRSIASDLKTEGVETIIFKVFSDSARTNEVASNSSVTIQDTSTPSTPVPTYSLSCSPTSVNEGDTFTSTVTTTNVAQGTTIYWSAMGANVDNSDFSSGSMTGSGTVGSNGTFQFSHTLANDVTTEGTETIAVKIFTNAGYTQQVGSTVNVTVNDTSQTPTVPSYSITPSKTSINEGETLTTTVTTSNVSGGTTLYWIVNQDTGTINSSDFSSGGMSGTGTISSNTFTISHTLANDLSTEGEEKFSIKLYTDSGYSNNVANTPLIAINDTSISATPPTYTLSTTATRFNEGDSFITTVTTTNVPNNTVLYWKLSGSGISEDDFNLANTVEGSGTIANNTFTFSHTIKEDVTTEGDEIISIKLYSDSARTTQIGNTLSVTIRDTSQPGFNIRVTAPNENEYIITGTDRNGSI